MKAVCVTKIFSDILKQKARIDFQLSEMERGSTGCSHLDMELSDVRSLGERTVLKLRLGCDTAAHKQMTFNKVSARNTAQLCE